MERFTADTMAASYAALWAEVLARPSWPVGWPRIGVGRASSGRPTTAAADGQRARWSIGEVGDLGHDPGQLEVLRRVDRGDAGGRAGAGGPPRG